MFIIAEAGSNWKVGTSTQDWNMTKKLIDVAAKAGANAVKFQLFNVKSMYVNGIKNREINEKIKKYSLPRKMIPKIAKYCKKKKIEFMCTPFSLEEARYIDKFVNIHKIASCEITHAELLFYLLTTGKPVLISTGTSSNEEIKEIYRNIHYFGSNMINLMFCVSSYPAPIEQYNLLYDKKWNKEMGFEFKGVSDHTRNPLVVPMAACCKGFKFIEKHFTIDNKMEGPDHAYALTPPELEAMVKNIRLLEKMQKKAPPLKQDFKYCKRAIQAKKNIKKGERIVMGKNCDVLRPGNYPSGILPHSMYDVRYLAPEDDLAFLFICVVLSTKRYSFVAAKDIKKGTGIIRGMITLAKTYQKESKK